MAALREEVFTRDGGCVWPGCTYSPFEAPLQMAHLTHRGMGGSRERNTLSNTLALCEIHHSCLDGRTGLGILRRELNVMLTEVGRLKGDPE
jgi:hypothetical protein